MQQPCDVVAQGCLSHGNCFVDFLSPTHPIPSMMRWQGANLPPGSTVQSEKRGSPQAFAVAEVDRMSPIASPTSPPMSASAFNAAQGQAIAGEI